jgi:putative heme-binding domain-containing protein
LNFHDERFRFFAGNDHRDVAVANRKMSAGSWTHLAVTRDGAGEFRIYVNGELDTVGTKRTMDAFEGLDVGRTIPGAGGTAGELAEFRVWDRARTAVEILANFDRSLAGGNLPEGLVYHFDGQEKAGGPLRGRARVEGTLDGPSLMTAEEARAVREKFERFQQLTQTRGRVKAGRALFETACLVCHQVGGQGSNLAPPLDGAGHRGTEGLLRALLTPSAAVEAGYRKFQVETRDGEIHEGFLVARDAGEIVLRQPNAGEVRLEADTVKRARFTRFSLMPEGLLEAKRPEQVSDLFAFLRTLH